MFFNHVQLHKYDLTNKGISQACYDEIVTELGDAYVHLTEKQLWILACLLYTSPSPRDQRGSRMPSSA